MRIRWDLVSREDEDQSDGIKRWIQQLCLVCVVGERTMVEEDFLNNHPSFFSYGQKRIIEYSTSDGKKIYIFWNYNNEKFELVGRHLYLGVKEKECKLLYPRDTLFWVIYQFIIFLADFLKNTKDIKD